MSPHTEIKLEEEIWDHLAANGWLYAEKDAVGYANTVAAKTLESEVLQKQAANNSKEQFANSPDLRTEIMDALIESMEVQQELSKRALASPDIQAGLQRLLAGTAGAV